MQKSLPAYSLFLSFYSCIYTSELTNSVLGIAQECVSVLKELCISNTWNTHMVCYHTVLIMVCLCVDTLLIVIIGVKV